MHKYLEFESIIILIDSELSADGPVELVAFLPSNSSRHCFLVRTQEGSFGGKKLFKVKIYFGK